MRRELFPSYCNGIGFDETILNCAKAQSQNINHQNIFTLTGYNTNLFIEFHKKQGACYNCFVETIHREGLH